MMRLVWDTASSPAEGEDVIGDAYAVRTLDEGYLLVVADGLGHGRDASIAADAAIRAATNVEEGSPSAVLRRCHLACQRTRGVVMTVVHVDTVRGALCWAGVGNVEAVLLRNGLNGPSAREAALLAAGVVGVALPPLREQSHDLAPGDIVALATDGIRRDFVDELRALAPVTDVTNRIIDRHHLAADDALVLVARCEAG